MCSSRNHVQLFSVMWTSYCTLNPKNIVLTWWTEKYICTVITFTHIGTPPFYFQSVYWFILLNIGSCATGEHSQNRSKTPSPWVPKHIDVKSEVMQQPGHLNKLPLTEGEWRSWDPLSPAIGMQSTVALLFGLLVGSIKSAVSLPRYMRGAFFLKSP